MLFILISYFHLFHTFFVFLIGHLAPMDLPAQSLDMLKRFIHDESFADTILPSDRKLNHKLIRHK